MEQRQYTAVDRLIIGASTVLGRLSGLGGTPVARRDFPARSGDENLSAADKRRAGRYMRVNHVGEICAQALYHSQGMTARDADVAARMRQAAAEENDHLAWCEQRLNELGGRKSWLNPLWGLGAFAAGAAAGLAGDKWNLGFVAETERQVAAHLETHLGKLPAADTRSREVVAQMKTDERAHAAAAIQAGAAPLPPPVRALMKLAAKTMTSTAHWI